jgi:hypothetical protein
LPCLTAPGGISGVSRLRVVLSDTYNSLWRKA